MVPIKIFLVFSCICGVYSQIEKSGALIAYDCADEYVKLTRISLRGVKPCIDLEKSSVASSTHITLIQRKRYTPVHVYTCLISVQALIQHCGMFSHTSDVDEGFMSYIHKIKGEECKRIHNSNNKNLDLHKIMNGLSVHVKLNSTVHTSATIAGYLNQRGECDGTTYSYNGVEYKDVIVTADITIKLRDYETVVDMEQKLIQLRGGAHCPYSKQYCFDDDEGEVTWEVRDQSNRCSANNFDYLYEGPATQLTLNGSNSMYIIVNTNNTVFALHLLRQEQICGKMVWLTEQPRLGVIISSHLSYYTNTKKGNVRPENMNIFDEVLAKLLYLELAVKTQHQALIYESIKKRCELRRSILQNRLALAHSAPDVVSSLIKETPGHTGRIMGEVLYVATCVPKVVTYRNTKECYEELPITYNNKSYFMAPISRIIQNHGTQINCDNNMYPMVNLQGKWVQYNPQLRESFPAPFIVDANDPTEEIPSIEIAAIHGNGIYTKQEMDNFMQNLLFPNERDAISNIVARRIVGVDTESQGFSFSKMFSNFEFGNMLKSASHLIWGVFSGIASYIPGLFVICFGVLIFKYLIGVFINYSMLKEVGYFTPIVTVLGSLWNMITRLLLFRGQKPKQPKCTPEEPAENHELLLLNSNQRRIIV